MSALDKVIALAAAKDAAPEHSPLDMTGEDLVAAANSALADLYIMLADGDGDDDDDDNGGPSDNDADDEQSNDKGSDNAHSGHPLFKKMVKRGMPAKAAAKACARADKKVKSTALAEAALIALGGLNSTAGDWVELTAYDPHVFGLAGKGAAGDGSKPYGDVAYADPGYQSDGKKRYPIDNEGHVRAALSYISKAKNAGAYTAQQLASIKSKIKAAARKLGIEVSGGSGSEAQASMTAEGVLALARGKGGPPMPPQAMHHPPFTGSHSHGHHTRMVHDHQHFHNGDSEHEMHAHGSGDGDDNWAGGGW